jgi:RNA polymerase sigma-70 factor (ECF subfamily)
MNKNIIKLASNNDNKAQKIIYDKYCALLYGICLCYIKNNDDAKDALQESFIKIFNKISSFKHNGSFEGWLRRITINTCLNYIIYNKKYKYFDDITELNELSIIDNSINILDKLECEHVIKLIHNLPKSMMLTINFIVIDGYSSKQVSKMLGIKESTVRSNLNKSRKRLIKDINKLENYDIRTNKENISVSNN